MEWKEREKSDTYNLFIENGYNPLTAITLSNAGIKGLDDAWDFLYGDELISPRKIKNIDDAAQIIWKHIFQKDRICIFGDYDTDGVTSSAIMFLTLKRLGADVAVRLPDRIGEGYGINSKAVEEQIELGAKLFITVDNGVRANAEVDLIKRQDCDVVVIDELFYVQPTDEELLAIYKILIFLQETRTLILITNRVLFTWKEMKVDTHLIETLQKVL